MRRRTRFVLLGARDYSRAFGKQRPKVADGRLYCLGVLLPKTVEQDTFRFLFCDV